jgi:hypothetical protein
MDQHDAQQVLTEIGIELDRFPQKVVNASDGLHPGKTAPRHHYAEQRRTPLHGALGTGFFQVRDHAIANLDSISERFHRQGVVLQAWKIEKIGDRAQRQHEMVIRQRMRMRFVAVRHPDALVGEIDVLHIPFEEVGTV